MGTSSGIVAQFPDGTYRVAYCSYDGYLSGVGARLLKFYKTDEQVHKMVDKQYFGSLEADPNDIEDPHDRWDDMTFATREEAVLNAFQRGFAYLWEDGVWKVAIFGIDDPQDKLPLFTEITREIIILEDQSMISFFLDKEKPVTQKQQIQDMYDSLQEQAKSNPNMEVLGDPARGIVGVSIKF